MSRLSCLILSAEFFVLIGAKLVSICIEMVAEVIKKGESFNATVLLPMVIGVIIWIIRRNRFVFRMERRLSLEKEKDC